MHLLVRRCKGNFLLLGGMPSHCIDALTRILPCNNLHAHHGAACAGHGMSKLVRWPGRLALASVPHHNVIVASEEERGEVDTYIVLSSYYYDMSTINNMTRHTTQKKNQHRMMSAMCQLCQAVVLGRHEDMSSKLTFDDIKNVKICS
jgi:hypothetical protein